MVLGISLILIHISYRYVYNVLLLQSCCSETIVVGLINTVIIVTCFAWGQHSVFDIVIVTCDCAVLKLQNYYLLFVIVINTHVLLLSLYYSVITFALF